MLGCIFSSVLQAVAETTDKVNGARVKAKVFAAQTAVFHIGISSRGLSSSAPSQTDQHKKNEKEEFAVGGEGGEGQRTLENTGPSDNDDVQLF